MLVKKEDCMSKNWKATIKQTWFNFYDTQQNLLIDFYKLVDYNIQNLFLFVI